MSKKTKYNFTLIILIFLLIALPISVSADGGDTSETPVTTPLDEGGDDPVSTEEPVEDDTVTPVVTVTEETIDNSNTLPIATATEEPVDGGEKPEETPVATETEKSVDGGETPEETPVATETEEPTDSGETPEETPVATEEETETVSEILAEIPDGTGLVILDQDGEPEPLVTQDAADAIVEGDPVWCPEGQAPTPGLNGCTATFADMNDLLNNIGDPNANGTIWITSGVINDTSEIFITDTYDTLNWDNFTLTLQGGWNGISGDTTIGTNSIFTVPITILDWGNNITLNNITVQNTDDDGVFITTSGNVSLDTVTSSGNQGDGLYINASNANLSNITTNDNQGNGTVINTNSFGAFGPVTLTGNNQFNNNGESGLDIHSMNGINVTNILANNNNDAGVALSNGNSVNEIIASNISASGNKWGLSVANEGEVTLSDITVNNNQDTGLWVHAGHDANLSNITANENQELGIDIYASNINASDITANNNSWIGFGASTFGGDISITGTNTFIGNRGDGILADLRDGGNIYVENVEVANSGGIHLETSDGSVVLTGTNLFTNNTTQGAVVFIDASGDVLVEGVTNIGSGIDADGALIITPGNITVRNSTFQDSEAYGLKAGYEEHWQHPNGVAPASLTLENVAFSGNGIAPCVIYGDGTVTVTPEGTECRRVLLVSEQPENNKENEDVLGVFLPLQVIDFIGTPVDLNCTEYSGTFFEMPNKNQVTFLCPTSGEILLTEILEDDEAIPDVLPEGVTFLSALSTTLRSDGLEESLTIGKTTISFVIPTDTDVEHISIFYWNGIEWLNLEDTVFTDGRIVYKKGHEEPAGFFSVEINFTGIFILGSK